MTTAVPNRVRETTTTSGSGLTLTLAAVTGRKRFSTESVGTVVPYLLEDADGIHWEVGHGTVQAGHTFDRTTVSETDTGVTSTKITLSAGTHRIAVALETADLVYQNSASVVSALGYTPYNATNPSSFISAISGAMVVAALGFTPVNPTALAAYAPLAGAAFTGPISVAGSGNTLTAAGSVTGQPVTLTASGSDADVGIGISPKGNGSVAFTATGVGDSFTPITSLAIFQPATDGLSAYGAEFHTIYHYLNTKNVAHLRGMTFIADAQGSGALNAIEACDMNAIQNGDGNVTRMTALALTSQTYGAGNVGDIFGLDFQYIGNSGAGTTTNQTGIRLRSQLNDGGGVVTNNLAIDIDDQTVGVNNWAIRTGLGNVKFGTLSASQVVLTDASKNLVSGGTLGSAAFTSSAAYDAAGLASAALASALAADYVSPLTTKGDLLGFSTALGRLGAGTNTHVLTADSTATFGFKWAAPAGGGGDALTSNPLSQFAATTSAQLLGVLSDETGSGLAVFNNGPTFIAPILATPASGTLTNCTGLPAAGVVGTAAILGLNTFSRLQTITQGTANEGVLASTGYSLTGSGASNMLDFAGTWNTSGVPKALVISITRTAVGAGAKLLDLRFGTTSGFEVYDSGGTMVVRFNNNASGYMYNDGSKFNLGQGIAIASGGVTLPDTGNLAFGTSTGTKIGTGATQKIGFWNATPVVQPTGYGTPTNAAQQGSFDATTITLPNLAAQLARLILDIKGEGLVGA